MVKGIEDRVFEKQYIVQPGKEKVKESFKLSYEYEGLSQGKW